MIRYLAIRRLAVIDQLEIEFGEGFTVLTGETGAGKSILVEAVNLLLGGRATPDLVRSGADAATIQAIIEAPDGRELLLRRELSAQGRSRAFLDGDLVTASALRDCTADLIDLHGQHEHQSLLSPSTQLALLDRFANLEPQRAEVRQTFAALAEARGQLAVLESTERDRVARLDVLEFSRAEIDKASPRDGEDDELAAERVVLANADKLARLCVEGYAALYDDEGAVLARLAGVWKRVGDLSALDPRFAPFLDSRATVEAPLQDLSLFLRDYAAGLDHSGDRLQNVEDRLAQIDWLKRRYGPTLGEVIERQRAIELELEDLNTVGDRIPSFRARVKDLSGAYSERAGALSAARRAAAGEFARRLSTELQDLAMPTTRCELRFQPVSDAWRDWGPTGIDSMELYFSPNPGEELRPLTRIASGGEMSRVMLAIKTLATTDEPGKTLIFDEVDAGIGGSAADIVGCRLRALSRGYQVLAITHLAQVAAHADAHFRVAKHLVDGRTIASVEALDSEQRVTEVARMMGGRHITSNLLDGARDLVQSRAGGERRKSLGGEGETGQARLAVMNGPTTTEVS